MKVETWSEYKFTLNYIVSLCVTKADGIKMENNITSNNIIVVSRGLSSRV